MSPVNSQVPPFLSMYDLKFGERKARPKGMCREVSPEWEREPVEVAVLATVIKSHGINCIDSFGRWADADTDQTKEVLSALENYVDFMKYACDSDTMQNFESNMTDRVAFAEWHSFGWEAVKLPDMSAIYNDWQGKKSADVRPPKASAKVYAMIAGYLKKNMTTKDYVDFSGNYAAGDKSAKTALKELLAEVGEDMSDKPIADVLNNARAFALKHLSEEKKV